MAASNLRATNYSIPPADRHKVCVPVREEGGREGGGSVREASNTAVISPAVCLNFTTICTYVASDYECLH